jgi:hypothetical protein
MLKTHNHAFWVYGVIVGLAIREGLVKVISQNIDYQAPVTQGPATPHDVSLQAIRLVLFLGVIIRFYLGSAIYFDSVYCSDKSDKKYPTKNYGIDFLLGLIHFILFFGWCETLTRSDHLVHGFGSFLLGLGMILLYDMLWWIVNAKYSTTKKIAPWAILNLVTVLCATVVWALLTICTDVGPKWREVLALLPVGFMTVVDFGEMFSNRNLITDWIVTILQRDGLEPNDSST